MGRLFKICLCIAAALSSVAAQNASPPAPLPPAMRSAIDRLTKGTAAGKRVFHFAAPTNPELRDKSLREICSVPLVEMHIDNPERFTMLTATPPAIQDRMPLAQMPAPPCERAAPTIPALPPRR
jgi:hypothetical protein